MISRLTHASMIAAAAAACFDVASARAASTVTAIPQVNGAVIQPFDINSSGVVAGTVVDSSNNTFAVASDGTTNNVFGPSGSNVSGITNGGVVYGTAFGGSTPAFGYRAFTYALPTGPIAYVPTSTAVPFNKFMSLGNGLIKTPAVGVNNAGVIVGGLLTNNNADTPKGVYVPAGGALTYTPTTTAVASSFTSVNSAGLAAGFIGTDQYLDTAAGDSPRLATFDTATTGATVTNLGQPAGFRFIDDNANNANSYKTTIDQTRAIINDSGTIVANAVSTSNSTVFEGVKYAGGTFAALTGLTGGLSTGAGDINAAGNIVGTDYAAGKAVAWLNGLTTATDLNTFLPAGSGWVLTAASGISDTGTVTGLGTLNGVTQAFILTGVPEPTAVAGLLSAVVVGLRRRRTR